MNLDAHSSTALLPEALEAMLPWLSGGSGGKPSRPAGALEAREAVALARERVAALISARDVEEIIFTSDATEAANLAVKGAAFAAAGRGRHIVVSAVEHPSVLNSAAWLETQGFTVTRVGVDADGRVNPAAFGEAFRDDTIMACLQLANHDVGTIQPVRRVSILAAERGVPLFVDASACGGAIALDFRALGASLGTLAPVRFNGPPGCGVLWRRPGVSLSPLIHGGDHEFGLRAGMENVAAIVGTGVAAGVMARELPERAARFRELQSTLLRAVLQRVDHIALTGPPPGEERLPDQLSFVVEFCEAEGLALILDLAGIRIGAGPSCVSRATAKEGALHQMGINEGLARGAIRLTLNGDNTPADVEPLADAIARAVGKLRAVTPEWEDHLQGRLPALLPARILP